MATVTSWTASAISAALALKAAVTDVLSKADNLNSVVSKSAARTNLNVVQRAWFDVRDYGAVGDNTADDTTAINNAIIAAGVNGGTVFFPSGIFKTTAAIEIGSDNVILQGSGGQAGQSGATRLGATIIKPSSGAMYDGIRTRLPPVPGTSTGYVLYGVGIRDLVVDMGNSTGTTTGQGNGVHFYGVRYGHCHRVQVINSKNYAFLIEGDATPNFSYNNNFIECLVDICAGGFRFTAAEQCLMYRCIVKGLTGNTTAATQPYSGTSSGTAGYMTYGNVGWLTVDTCTFGNIGTYTNDAVKLDNGLSCVVTNSLFDHVKGTAIHTTAPGHIITGNRLNNPCGSSGGAAILLGAGSSIVKGNVFQASSPNYSYCIAEAGAYVGNVVADNVTVVGTTGAVGMNTGSTKSQIHHNVGYNPIGLITAPSMPTSTVAYVNIAGGEFDVFITGGTVTVIAIDGNATGLTSGTFRVGLGQSITITYSAAPSWKWIGY